MGTGLEVLAALSAAAGTVASVAQLTAKAPVDPAKAKADADAKAAQSANARLAARTKALAANSLLTGAPGGSPTGTNTTFGG